MLDPKLKNYIEKNILPKYQNYDKGHNINHIEEVINFSFELATPLDLDMDMVYTIASFHDLGIVFDRANHHLNSAVMLREDEFVRSFFSPEQINIMADAVEDHRASCKHEPRSIYGSVVSSADRKIEVDVLIMRAYYYRVDKMPVINLDDCINEIFSHLNNKYGVGGYMRLPILTKNNDRELKALRELLSNENGFKDYCKGVIHSNI